MKLVDIINQYTRWLNEYNKGDIGVGDLASIQGYLKILEAEFNNAKKPKITFGEFVDAMSTKLGKKPQYANIFICNSLGNDYTRTNLKNKERALVQYLINYGDKSIRFVVDQPLDTKNAKFKVYDYTPYTYATVTGDNVGKFNMQMPLRQIAESGRVGRLYAQLLASKEMTQSNTRNS